tara:strand:+ start:496 stop:1281 length:786 start_codon:yes stop_codon:yes gene_type:complete
MKKNCRICKETFPIENFDLVGDKYGSRRGECKRCRSEHKAKSKGEEHYKKYKKEMAYREELHQLQKIGKRRCRICDTIKILDDFPNDNSGKVFYNKKSYCKPCAHNTWRVPKQKTTLYKKQKSGWDKNYREKHKEKLNKKINERYHNNPEHKLRVSLRNSLGRLLRKSRVKKSESAIKLVGVDIPVLKKHIESLWEEGMTWDNWSRTGWHIDHIIPLSSFDLSKIEEQRIAFHYTNLQPLWAKDNLSKGSLWKGKRWRVKT